MNETASSPTRPADPTPPANAPWVEETGPWPFVTRRAYRLADQSKRIWSSRHHRKDLLVNAAEILLQPSGGLWRCLWMPRQLNWWIGIIFAVGSLLFALASLLSLSPELAASWSLNSTQVNAVFFAGSIPFTSAAYLQLYQAANASEISSEATLRPQRRAFFGWRPREIGWLSCALQFVGTVLFNFNTYDAMMPSLNWFQQDMLVWVPNIVGSILFLASGYLAFIETCHAYWAWRPSSLSWWVVFASLLGCVGFILAAVFAISLPTQHALAVRLSIVFTLAGSIGFLVGSLLMLPESVTPD